MLTFGLGASAQIIVNESFEGTALPSGWTSFSNATLTTARTPSYGTLAGTPCAGAKAVYVNNYESTFSTTVQNWFLVYTSTASNATDLNYSFKYLAKGYSTTGAINGTFSVEYSVDGGTTWVNLSPSVTLNSPNATPIACTTVSGVIPAGTIPASANFKLKFNSSVTTASGGDYYMGIDDVQLTQAITSAPSCTTVAAPANAATGVSVTPTISYPASAGTSSYLINLGTTPGGTDVLNAFNNGTSLSYVTPTASPLLYNTMYYVTVSPSNNIGTATGCTESTFTTLNIPCPTVSSPAAAAIGTSLSPTITWGAVNGATGYRLTVGTTAGGSDVLNDQDLGSVTSYTFATLLNPSTQYFYTVRSYQGVNVSTACTERNFTTGSTAPPVNDNCSGAVSLTVNPDLACGSVTAGNTLGATMSMAATPCFGAPNDDVWYSFVATSTSHVISLTNVVSTGTVSATDMYFQVFSGACGSMTSLLCSDDNINTINGLTVGANYYVRVYTYTANANGFASFNICVGTLPPPPANDNCTSPTTLTPGASFAQNAITGTTSGATLTADTTATTACQTTRYADTWYSVVVPASGNITIETATTTGTAVTDTVMGVYTGSCGSLVSVGCSDDIAAGTNNFSKVSLTGQTPGQTLLIGVWNYSSTNNGQFQISAYDASVLATSDAAQVKNNKLTAYPNPFADVLNISDVKNVKSISIVDIAGRIVKTIEKPSSSLQLKELNSGMYMVILNMNDGSRQTIKAIKQ